MGRATRLGKYPDRDGKLATSALAVPAKAGIHASAASNFAKRFQCLTSDYRFVR
jgi:hypothetical protein